MNSNNNSNRRHRPSKRGRRAPSGSIAASLSLSLFLCCSPSSLHLPLSACYPLLKVHLTHSLFLLLFPPCCPPFLSPHSFCARVSLPFPFPLRFCFLLFPHTLLLHNLDREKQQHSNNRGFEVYNERCEYMAKRKKRATNDRSGAKCNARKERRKKMIARAAAVFRTPFVWVVPCCDVPSH